MVLAGIVASLQGGAGVLEALCRQFEALPSQIRARASPLSSPCSGMPPGLVARAAVTDANGDCDAEAIATLLQAHRLAEETDAQIRAAAHGICAAYGVSQRLGCPAARCFDAVRESYARLRLREDLKRNAFAVPQSTVRMLMGLPAVTVALGELLGAHPLGVLFGSVQGVCCLLLGSVCYAVDGQAIGVGAGQQSRIHCTRLAGTKADTWFLRQADKVLDLPFKPGLGRPDRDNAVDGYINQNEEDVTADGVWQRYFTRRPEPFTRAEQRAYLDTVRNVALGSDAFFPFSDNIERAFRSGVQYVAEPGGSIRDDAVIDCCDKHGMVMAFTGLRLFHH